MSEMQVEMEQPKERFVIDNDKKAAWAMQKIAEAQADTAKWTDYYKSQMAIIKQQNDDYIAYWTECLKSYFLTAPHKETPTTLRYKLPNGELILSKPGVELVHADDESTIRWAEQSGEDALVKVEKRLAWADLKKRLSISEVSVEDEFGNIIKKRVAADAVTGEIIPGISVQDKPEEFKLSFK